MKPLIFLSFLAILFAVACEPKPQCDSGPTILGTIDSTTARRLVNYFANDSTYRRPTGISNGLPDSSDTRCVWFSLSQLQALAERIKCEKGDGIRFYFAAYDSAAIRDLNIDSNYRHYSTLIMVSTVARDSALSPGDTLRRHFDYFHDMQNNMRGGIVAVPENQGELCPPPTNCTEEGALLLP